MNNPDTITFEIKENIGIITLNIPPENYLPIPGFIPLDVFKQWTSEENLKGVIIAGKGRNFSAGGNLANIFSKGDHPEALQKLVVDGLELLNSIQNLEIPVIAAINRVCFGGGLEIALACHIRVASENALLAFPEVNQNLLPGMGGNYRLLATTGLSQSAKIILGGDTINATDAKEIGLVDYIAPKDQAFEYSWKLMQKMTHGRPVKVIRAVMKALNNAMNLTQEEALKEETRLFCSLAMDETERRKTEGI
jgi:enoyl-CoA hydratase